MAPKVIGTGITTQGAVVGGTRVSTFSGSTAAGVAGQLTQASEFSADPTELVPSARSVTTYHSTLFEDFNLQAIPTYNFFVEDEQVNPDLPQSASLDQLPRYVSLSWDPVPTRQVLISSRKGMRPLDPRPRPGMNSPALPVSSAKGSVANGYISPGAISALLVPPTVAVPQTSSFDEGVFLSSPSAGGLSAPSSIDHPLFQSVDMPQPTTRIRVNLVDPSIAGAVSDQRIQAAVDHTHLATLGSLAKLLPALEVVSEFNQDVPVRNPVPVFPVPPTTLTVTYIGYVLERYTLGIDGSMTLSRTVDIDDIETSTFIDRQVLYGARYSYRIKTIVQWAHPPDAGFLGPSSLSRTPEFNPAGNGKQASFYSGDWSDWARATVIDTSPPDPPEEIYVRPVSARRSVEITWKVPGDPQRDLLSLRLVRSVSMGGAVEDWSLLGEFIPTNGTYTDFDVDYADTTHVSYVYAMYAVSYHGEFSMLSDQFEVRLSSRYGEEPIRRVAPKGADPTVHASVRSTRGPRLTLASDEVSFYCRSGRSDLPLFERDYLVEVQSLSTGERAVIQLSLDSSDVLLLPGGPPRQPGLKA